MKKILFAILVVLMLSFASAFAQETAVVTEVTWTDELAAAATEIDPDGQFFYVADTGLMMWIPSVLHDQEISAELNEGGMVVMLSTTDETASVFVNVLDLEDVSLEDMYSLYLEEPTYSEVEWVNINGLGAVSYIDNEYDTMNLAFEDVDGNMITFNFSPYSDEGFMAVATIMAASIMEAE